MFSHSNVIEYKESFLEMNPETLCLVMEYAEKGDILQRINKHVAKKTHFAEYELWSTMI